ncbi:hypothetical protein GGP41_009635 [Bipolaris sorokiniana]|uniref:Peptidase S53 domain-containing protein n=1 Tax=Cochliobolus sativus TaxID=45130 RepID=A0A8H6DRL0_COCSA|nr:hypothetical protein GGP41_009635 [Bipolaris sorokiniana]
MDVQAACSIIWLYQIRVYQVYSKESIDATGPFNIFLDTLVGSNSQFASWIAALARTARTCGGVPLSNVISPSCGQVEGDGPKSYQERQCQEWIKLALQGVSVLIASGDSGVANMVDGNNQCLDASGKREWQAFLSRISLKLSLCHGCRRNNTTRWNHSQRRNGSHRYHWQLIIILWQRLLKPFLPPRLASHGSLHIPKRVLTQVRQFNLQFLPMHITRRLGNRPSHTSRIWQPDPARGRHVGGNPHFRQHHQSAQRRKHPEIFNDATVGSNPGCGTKGFAASFGWDLVTGLGTPRYQKMREVFLSLV